MTKTLEKPARVEVDEAAVWAALENFFTGSASEARQMRTGNFGPFDSFVSGSIPLLEVTVDGVRYAASIQEVNKAGQYLAGAVITIAYFADEVYYRHILVDLEDIGGAFNPQAKPTAQQKRWVSVD